MMMRDVSSQNKMSSSQFQCRRHVINDMKLRNQGMSVVVGGAEWFSGRVGPMAEDSRRPESAIDCRIDPMSDHWPLLVASRSTASGGK